MPTLLALAVLAAAVPADASDLPSVVYNVGGTHHKVYWTVDDHPTKTTDQFLDLFKQYGNLKATFFVVGWGVQAYYRQPTYGPLKRVANSVLRMKAEGHTIGNHSLSHSDFCKDNFPTWRVTYELVTTQNLLQKLTGLTPVHWRPPHGKICNSVHKAVTQLGLKSWLWDIDDYRVSVRRMWYLFKTRVARKEPSTMLLFHTNPSKLKDFLQLLTAPTTFVKL